MEYMNYPTNPKDAIAYAARLSAERGVDFVPVKLADGNPFGLKFAAVERDEVEIYTASGATVIE